MYTLANTDMSVFFYFFGSLILLVIIIFVINLFKQDR
jgi:hypothetical protein